ncbi:MAG: DNA polymerase I [Gammaproteobacteria bacterium]|nr:DNA polymerase I [Gammaproteobacteria bacterium]
MSDAAKQPTLILVDGSSYLFRAYHALPALTNSKGEPTGAVYGVINMLRKLRARYPQSQLAVVFDAKGKTFRNDLYTPYKAHRPPMPEELRQQIEPIHAIIRAMGLPLLSVSGVEADDVIGTLATQASALQIDTLISTSDKDLAQLVGPHVTLVNTMTDTLLDRQGVIDKFGIPPERMVDFLTLTGDSADNIPGVSGVGEKTAVKWLQQYQSLDGVVAHANEMKGKIGEKLRASLGELPLYQALVTIKCDVPLPVTAQSLQPTAPDTASLRAWFQRLEFKSWTAELSNPASNPVPTVSAPASPPVKAVNADYRTVLTHEELDQWITLVNQAALIAFDTETTGLDYMQAELVGLSLCVQAGTAAYIPVGHTYPGAPTQLAREEVLRKLKPILEDPTRPKLGQNLKYDAHIMTGYGIHMQGMVHDTMLQSYVLDSNARHDMDTMALRHLDHHTIHYEEVTGKGAKQIGFNQVAIQPATAYAAEDADITLRLHEGLWPQLQASPSLKRVYETIEMPLVPVLVNIEQRGVLIDRDMLRQQSARLQQQMLELEQRAYSEAGQTFNLSSPKQIQAILFEKMQLPVLEKTPTGQASTAESVLQELAYSYTLPKLILEYRTLSKLKSTYTDTLPEMINPRTGRVHTSYHQAVAATGRLSSTDPNLQNIPVRTEEGRLIRQAFIAPPGYRLLAADYSQIELRIMAHLSGDRGLLEAFAQGQDIHRATAAEVFAITPEQVSDEQRRSAKAINFGLIYGMSAFGLARQLNVERGLAQNYIDQYFSRYPGVKAYMDKTRITARERGYVETVFGRRLYLPEINAANHQRRQYAERTAINAPMQGTAADIIKRAMIDVHNSIHAMGLEVYMIMQVHDELVFEVPNNTEDKISTIIRDAMSQAANLHIPLVVDIGIGNNWETAH